MSSSILYCGDTDLTSAAAYLAGVMTHAGLPYDYVPSHIPLEAALVETPRSLFIFSDYPAAMVSAELQSKIVDKIAAGVGLLMIGGWESYHGFGGNWEGTPIGDALPVLISDQDDRTNFDQGAYLHDVSPSPATAGLPWRDHPPLIGGMNRIRAKSETQTVLEALPLSARFDTTGRLQVDVNPVLPVLVLGQHGQGRTAAFASDVAPHWVGGFVDWGPDRVTAQANGAGAIEVGSSYTQFWAQLLESLCS